MARNRFSDEHPVSQDSEPRGMMKAFEITEHAATDSTVNSAADVSTAESQLVGRACQGDKVAFEILAARYVPLLAREARKFVPPEDVDDVVQESILRWYKAFPLYRDEGKLAAWLRIITSRAVTDFWRSTRRMERRARSLKHELGPDTVQTARDVALKIDLERFLDTLTPDERVLCVMAFLEERPHQEIAEILGVSWVAVKVRCFRLKAKIRGSFTYEQ